MKLVAPENIVPQRNRAKVDLFERRKWAAAQAEAGWSLADIAAALRISPHTLRKNMDSFATIMAKAQTADVPEAPAAPTKLQIVIPEWAGEGIRVSVPAAPWDALGAFPASRRPETRPRAGIVSDERPDRITPVIAAIRAAHAEFTA